MTATLRRGQAVLIDTDLRYAGQPLRGRRGTVLRLGHAGSAFVCTCATSGALHAHNCPADLPLARTEVIRADHAAARGSATTAGLLLALTFGGLLWLALLSYGQQAMCALHDQNVRYCPGFTANDPKEPRP